MAGSVESVNIVHEVTSDVGGSAGQSAIDKRPAAGRVQMTATGLAGDRCVDTKHHGSPEQAVYAYAREDYGVWEADLKETLRPGIFGENLTTRGVDVSGAVIGETWHVGSAVVQVTIPRIPCATFGRWMKRPNWVKQFLERGLPGAYLRVIVNGDVAAGDTIVIASTPQHEVTIRDIYLLVAGDRDSRRLAAAIACPELPDGMRTRIASYLK